MVIVFSALCVLFSVFPHDDIPTGFVPDDYSPKSMEEIFSEIISYSPLYINQISLDELQSIPYLSPETSLAIFLERNRKPFSDLSDLERRVRLDPIEKIVLSKIVNFQKKNYKFLDFKGFLRGTLKFSKDGFTLTPPYLRANSYFFDKAIAFQYNSKDSTFILQFSFNKHKLFFGNIYQGMNLLNYDIDNEYKIFLLSRQKINFQKQFPIKAPLSFGLLISLKSLTLSGLINQKGEIDIGACNGNSAFSINTLGNASITKNFDKIFMPVLIEILLSNNKIHFVLTSNKKLNPNITTKIGYSSRGSNFLKVDVYFNRILRSFLRQEFRAKTMYSKLDIGFNLYPDTLPITLFTKFSFRGFSYSPNLKKSLELGLNFKNSPKVTQGFILQFLNQKNINSYLYRYFIKFSKLLYFSISMSCVGSDLFIYSYEEDPLGFHYGYEFYEKTMTRMVLNINLGNVDIKTILRRVPKERSDILTTYTVKF